MWLPSKASGQQSWLRAQVFEARRSELPPHVPPSEHESRRRFRRCVGTLWISIEAIKRVWRCAKNRIDNRMLKIQAEQRGQGLAEIYDPLKLCVRSVTATHHALGTEGVDNLISGFPREVRTGFCTTIYARNPDPNAARSAKLQQFLNPRIAYSPIRGGPVEMVDDDGQTSIQQRTDQLHYFLSGTRTPRGVLFVELP